MSIDPAPGLNRTSLDAPDQLRDLGRGTGAYVELISAALNAFTRFLHGRSGRLIEGLAGLGFRGAGATRTLGQELSASAIGLRCMDMTHECGRAAEGAELGLATASIKGPQPLGPPRPIQDS
jgi:hypothetical protein